VIAALQELILPRSEDYQALWQQVLQQFHELPLVLTLLLVAVLPGICEELLFRGFLLQGLRSRCSPWCAIVAAGILFGAFHVDPYRFVPVSLLGILFGYLVLKTGSILTAMVAHATNNSIAILISYAILTAQEQQKLPPQTTAESLLTVASLLQMLPMIAIALVVFIAGLRAMR
jgi:sodium transport system permease protein